MNPYRQVTPSASLLGPDGEHDVAAIDDELETDVDTLDAQFPAGYTRPQKRFLREPDQPRREEATPRGGALEDLGLEIGGGGDLENLEVFDSIDLEVI